MPVDLKPITLVDWLPCLRLRVRQSQRHLVAPNIVSLIQSTHPRAYPCGVHTTGRMVGFLMYGEFKYHDSPRWFISRLMIDAQHQRRGYGRAAMQAVIERIRTRHGAHEIWLSYSPDNVIALKLFHSLGFEPVGEASYGEIMVCLAV